MEQLFKAVLSSSYYRPPQKKKKKFVLSPALSYPRYIMQNRKCTQKMDKTIIYFMIGSEADTIINKRADMIMHKHKFIWKILFANQKYGISGVFCDLESLAASQNILAY